ncbi:hypothetical protein [Albirhodobacter sp. R86504]|uniref:hypothetical protein n=1 Tax=Albirhodobacter sp. R86504 TaxID=3093848 RepID=UPI00366E7DC5
MTKFNALITSTTLAGLMALSGPALADQFTDSEYPAGIMDAQIGSKFIDKDETSTGMIPTSDAIEDEYGLVDAQLGAAEPEFGGSMGEAAIPADQQLARDKGIIDNQSELGKMGAVTTADNASIGSIESVTPSGDGYDTVLVKVSETLETEVSQFEIKVPQGTAADGQIELAWTLSDLLSNLEAQI